MGFLYASGVSFLFFFFFFVAWDGVIGWDKWIFKFSRRKSLKLLTIFVLSCGILIRFYEPIWDIHTYIPSTYTAR
jgi:hypothetical protein